MFQHVNADTGEIVGTSYCTDMDMRSSNGFPYLMGELKLKHEMGLKGADHVFQSAMYYTARPKIYVSQRTLFHHSCALFCISSVTVLICCLNP